MTRPTAPKTSAPPSPQPGPSARAIQLALDRLRLSQVKRDRTAVRHSR